MANTTWNPADLVAVTLTGSNLIATSTATTAWVRAADRQITGKFYWEITVSTWVNAGTWAGMATTLNTPPNLNTAVIKSGAIFVAGVTGNSLGARVSGDIIGIALDAGAGLIWYRVAPAGNWNGSASANPAAGAGGISTVAAGGVGIPLYPAANFGAVSDAATANFGDSAFSGAVPSGFTSGFTSGASPALNALATQVAVEEWGTVSAATIQAVVTQVGLEMWASVAAASAAGTQARVMVMA
jgi:hypothetical protein